MQTVSMVQCNLPESDSPCNLIANISKIPFAGGFWADLIFESSGSLTSFRKIASYTVSIPTGAGSGEIASVLHKMKSFLLIDVQNLLPMSSQMF